MIEDYNTDLPDNLDLPYSIENKNSSTFTNENVFTGNKEKKHYLCSECKTLHLIKINEEKIIIECKRKIDLEDFLSNNILNSENLENYKFCQIHKENEKIGFCLKCKKDLCQNCKEVNDCENKQAHNFVEFKEKNDEINKKVKFILYALDEKDKYNKTTKSKNSQLSSISENNKGVTESIGELVDLKLFIKSLMNSKEKIPSCIHYENIINIYHYLCDKLKLSYSNKDNNQTKIRLFGYKFIKNNINKCSVIINNKLKKIEDCEFYELKKPETEINITLLKEDDIIDMSYMFNDCEVLQSISEDSEWSTNNVVNMSYMFCNCKSFSYFPKFKSKWDTSKVKNISNMFNGCKSLKEIKDISKWDTSEVKRMNKMFYECGNLENLENILVWDTKNVIDMSYLFYNCSKLINIDIENEKIYRVKWNTEKVENMSHMFYGCESLKQLPDRIASWNTSNVVYMQYMFYNCKNLTKLPDIDKWETQKVSYLNYMFGNCSSLAKLPNIENWNIDSLIDISFMLDGCISLKKPPDLSKWDKIPYKEGKFFEEYFLNKKIN